MSSDRIPVGSPPVPPGRHAAPGGWYPDPAQSGQERYWDGWQWSRSVRDAAPAPPGRSGGQFGAPGQPAPQGQPGPYGPGPNGSGPNGNGPYGNAAPGGQAPWMPNQPRTTDGVALASWGQRALAAIVDLVLVWVISQIVISIFNSVTGAGVRLQAATNAATAHMVEALTDPTLSSEELTQLYREAMGMLLTTDLYIQVAILLGLTIAYYTVFHGAISATPGKLMVGLRVVPDGRGAEVNGLDWWRAIVRATLYAVLGRFLLLIQLVNLLWPLWDKKRQTLHDKASGTQVVRIK